MDDTAIGNLIKPFYERKDTEGACRKVLEHAVMNWQDVNKLYLKLFFYL